MKVRKGDKVLVISGKDKGVEGKVIEAYPQTNKVLVEGVNRIKTVSYTHLTLPTKA